MFRFHFILNSFKQRIVRSGTVDVDRPFENQCSRPAQCLLPGNILASQLAWRCCSTVTCRFNWDVLFVSTLLRCYVFTLSGYTAISISRGVTRTGKRGTIPWAPNDREERRKVLTMSQALSSIQYICYRKTSVSNMGAPNLPLAPGAI